MIPDEIAERIAPIKITAGMDFSGSFAVIMNAIVRTPFHTRSIIPQSPVDNPGNVSTYAGKSASTMVEITPQSIIERYEARKRGLVFDY